MEKDRGLDGSKILRGYLVTLEIRAPELPLRLNICGGVADCVRGPASAKEGPFGIIIQHRTTTDSSADAGRRWLGIWVTCGNF